jgi:cephalosporin hydroxylase
MPAAAALEWRSNLAGDTLSGIHAGTMATRYKGAGFLKSPFDMALYSQLMERLRPSTVIEIGTYQGGSALWFADMMVIFGLSPRVVSIDIAADVGFVDSRIQFITADALHLGDVMQAAILERLPRPWLVVEDSAHYYETTHAVLDFFHLHLASGDYIVVEDGVVKFLPEPDYRTYQDGPNRALEDFLAANPDAYEIDRGLCDFYGTNVTYNPNGWLRRR